MGDILVNIAKDVDFNKVVTKDIFKTVFVDVVNPDQLAEAEADAEAFGMGALAQTDTFAIVTEDTAFAYSESTAALDKTCTPIPCEWDGGFGGDGNSNIWYLGGVPESLTVSAEDVDDIDGLGDFEPLSSPPPATPDAPIPDASFGVSDLNLGLVGPVLGLTDVYEYELQNNVVISFGEVNPSDPARDIINICNSEPCEGADTIPDNLTGELTVTVAAGALFLVELIADDPANSIFEAEIEFEAFGDTDGSGVIEVDETALWNIGSTDIGYGDFLFTGDSNSVGENATANYTITSIITDSLQFEECCFDVV